MKEVGPCWLWSVCGVQISEREVAMDWAEPEGAWKMGPVDGHAVVANQKQM